MALVVLLRGVNVGGHRVFRPSVLARELKRWDVVNVGAAGTFVVRRKVGRAALRAEVERRLPFDAQVMICGGGDILRLTAAEPFAGQRSDPSVVQFVSVLAKRARAAPSCPMDLPSGGEWCVRILGHDDRLVFGLYRREMRAIRHLDQLEKVFGAPVTTRSWSTIAAVARVLTA